MIDPAIAKKAKIERVHTDANGLQIIGNTVKLTLLDKDDNVMAIWWGAEDLLKWVEAVYVGDSTEETLVNVEGFGRPDANG